MNWNYLTGGWNIGKWEPNITETCLLFISIRHVKFIDVYSTFFEALIYSENLFQLSLSYLVERTTNKGKNWAYKMK